MRVLANEELLARPVNPFGRSRPAADGRYANSIAGKDGFEVCHGCAAEHDLSHWGIAASLSYGYLKP